MNLLPRWRARTGGVWSQSAGGGVPGDLCHSATAGAGVAAAVALGVDGGVGAAGAVADDWTGAEDVVPAEDAAGGAGVAQAPASAADSRTAASR